MLLFFVYVEDGLLPPNNALKHAAELASYDYSLGANLEEYVEQVISKHAKPKAVAAEYLFCTNDMTPALPFYAS